MPTTLERIIDEIAGGLMLRACIDPSRHLGDHIANLAHSRYGSSGLDIIAASKEILQLTGEPWPENNPGMIQSAFSSATGSNIFDAVVNASVVEPFRTGDSTIGWVSETEVADFKSNVRIRREQVEQMKLLPRGESADHLVPEFAASESYLAHRFARQFTIDSQDLVADDINALTEPARLFGAASLRLKRDLVYTILLVNADLSDSVALFHATHNNLNTSVALSAANLDAAIASMENLTENGVPVDVEPAFLVVPPSLRGLARRLIRDMSGLLQVRSDTRLENGVTDPVSGTTYAGSATTWFLSAARGPLEFGFRESATPTVSSWVLSKGQWGFGYSVRYDVGSAAVGFNGIQKNTA